jgi:hypothetical protein
MNQLPLNANSLKGVSFPVLSRLVFAVVAGYLISTVGEPQSFTELVKIPGFIPAFFTSIGIAIIAVEQVNYSTLVVHRRYFWYDTSFTKVSWQITLCFVMPFLTIFLLASGYYAYYNHFILDTRWTTMYGWQIFFMLLALNLMFTMAQIQIKTPPGAAELPPNIPEIPSTNFALPPVLMTSLRTVAFIIHYNGNNMVYYMDGGHIVDPRSLKELFKLLDPDLYRMNPKMSIIRLSNIKNITELADGSLKVELITPEGMVTKVCRAHKNAYLGYY